MQFPLSNHVLQDSPDYDKKENSKRYNVLLIENIEKVALLKCKSTNDNYKCDGCCSHKFSNPEVVVDSVSRLRQKIWDSNISSSRNKGRDVRNTIVLGELLANRYKDGKDSYQINFVINGVRVCKYFYFKSTGLSERLFNTVFSYVTNKNCTKLDDYFDKLLQTPRLSIYHRDLETIIKRRPSQYPKIKDTSLKDNVLAFLDVQFAIGIDFAPENSIDRYTPLSWNELYGIYKKYCSQLCIAAVDYSFFCKIRLFIKNEVFNFTYIFFTDINRDPITKKTGNSEALDGSTCLANNALNLIEK